MSVLSELSISLLEVQAQVGHLAADSLLLDAVLLHHEQQSVHIILCGNTRQQPVHEMCEIAFSPK